jgi:DHA1 family multidrug resistance protein-like MFS transporter
MKHRELLRISYWAGFLLTIHVALISYINSSFLATKIPETLVGALYTASAILGVIGLFVVPRLINRFGSKAILGLMVLFNVGNLLVLILCNNVALVATSFVIYFASNTCLYLGLDILIEHWSANSEQGSVRGTYLTFMNIGFMLGPLAGGYIADRLGFGVLYGFSIVLLLPVLGILLHLPSITATHASKANILSLAKKFLNHKDFSAVFFVNFILQFFYAWMVIYTPIYLHEHAHIPWDTIGIMFTIMLSAFVLSQYLLGKLADKFHIERGMMTVGLVIMGVATLFVMRALSMTFWILAAVLFATRIGASIVEVMTESYFFKRVNHDDTGSIGFFRNTYPFAYIFAPLLGSAILAIAPMKLLFLILGIICFISVLVPLGIKASRSN